MAFKRALWRSGLTYQQTCRTCRTLITYMDDILDFRPWFPDGFVYCPRCKTPLRHNEAYAINAYPGTPGAVPNPPYPPQGAPVPHQPSVGQAFCTNCGKPFNPGDLFCSGCGIRRN